MPANELTIVWFRQDLRLDDNPALNWAAVRGAVLPVYILDTANDNPWPLGGASLWWLHHALTDLGTTLDHNYGSSLVLRKGNAEKIISELITKTSATAVTWNRCYEPYTIARDKRLQAQLQENGIECVSHNGSLIAEPWEITTAAKTPFKVYTPFSKACFAKSISAPLPPPNALSSVAHIKSESLESWKLLPTQPDWSGGFSKTWTPIVSVAHKMLRAFITAHMGQYKTQRDQPGTAGTSRLSPYLHFGQISPRTVWHAVKAAMVEYPVTSSGAEIYLKEILWREFSYHLLYHFPHIPSQPFNPRFENFPWQNDADLLRCWQRGKTGYPLVDAGMRQLWQTGWMHNRELAPKNWTRIDG